MIVQCGARRSGNFVLWRTLNLLLHREADYTDFLARSGRLEPPLGFTHDLPTHTPVGVYVVRDGRDAISSHLHFVVTPEYRSRYPDCTRTSVEDLLTVPGFFERRVHEWRDHVRSYLEDPRPWYLVRYEDLCGPHKERTIVELGSHLGLKVTREHLDSILSKTTVSSCRSAAPGHVHAGRTGGYARTLSHFHQSVFEEIAGAELAAMGYSRLAPYARKG